MAEKLCEACKKPVKWVRMQKSGNWMILDAKPKQMVSVEASPQSGNELGVMVKVYEPHWSTCPESEKFRKRPPLKESAPGGNLMDVFEKEGK